MKSLKTIVCTACLVGSMTAVGFAQNINTVAGVASVPNTVKVVTLSNTSIKPMLHDAVIYEAKKPSNQSYKMQQGAKEAIEAIEQMGIAYDLYQLQGADATGEKDAIVFALDMKSTMEVIKLDDAKDPMASVAMQMLEKGDLDPITEQFMLTAVNSQLPTGAKTFDLTESLPKEIERKSQAMYPAIGSDLNNTTQITVQDVKPLTKIHGATYNTYTISSRIIGNTGGTFNPYYANAAVVMNPAHPTLYLAITSDVQRTYFEPILHEFYKSIK